MLGRAHVEGFACDVLNFRLQPRHLLREGVGHARERVAVHLHAGHFHFGQHGDEGAFEGFVDGGDGRAVELGFEPRPEAVGDVGVFGCVFHGVGDGGAVEGDGLFAGAEERFDRDGQVAQIGFRQRVHAMGVEARVEGGGHEHRVIEGRDADAVAGEDLPVIFHVLADLQDRGVFEDGFQGGEHIVHRQLAGGELRGAEEVIRAGAVGEGDVAGLRRVGGERDSHQFGAHFVERGGFGVHRDDAPVADRLHPCVQGIHRGDGVVGVEGEGEGRGFGLVGVVDFGSLAFGQGGGGGDLQAVGHAAGEGAEFHPVEEVHDRVGFRRADFEVVEGHVQRRVGLELDELARDADLVGVFDEGFAAFGLFDFVGAGEERFEIAILLDQQGGGLDADAGGAGDVVDAVSGEGLDIDHAVGADAEFLEHFIGADGAGFHRVEHHHAGADELHQVLVGGDDGDVAACFGRLTCQRGDDVVGLEPFGFDAGDVEGAGGVAGQGELRAQVFGQFGAIGLVERVDGVAERLGRMVEDDGDMGGRAVRGVGALVAFEVAEEDVAETRDRPDGQAVGFAGERRQRVIGAEDIGRAVDQVEVAALAEAHLVHPLSRGVGGRYRMIPPVRPVPEAGRGRRRDGR